MLLILAYLVSKIYYDINLRHSSTTNVYKWENNKTMFIFMPHIMAKFTKYMVRTFLVENPDTGQKYSFCNSGWVGVLTNVNPLDQIRNICKRNTLLRGLEVGEVIPFPVWIIFPFGLKLQTSVKAYSRSLFTVVSTTTQPPPTHQWNFFKEF